MQCWILFNGDEIPQCVFFIEDHMNVSITETYKKLGQKIILARRYIDYREWTDEEGTRVLYAKRVAAHDHVIQL